MTSTQELALPAETQTCTKECDTAPAFRRTTTIWAQIPEGAPCQMDHQREYTEGVNRTVDQRSCQALPEVVSHSQDELHLAHKSVQPPRDKKEEDQVDQGHEG